MRQPTRELLGSERRRRQKTALEAEGCAGAQARARDGPPHPVMEILQQDSLADMRGADPTGKRHPPPRHRIDI